MPQWLNKKAFAIGAFFGGLGNYSALSQSGYSMDGWLMMFVGIVVGGIFWGWVLTKFASKWFPTGE